MFVLELTIQLKKVIGIYSNFDYQLDQLETKSLYKANIWWKQILSHPKISIKILR